jgi:hypothetical protein
MSSWPLFVCERGMLSDEAREQLYVAGFMPIELHRIEGMRPLPLVLTRYGESVSLWTRLRLWWALRRWRS